MKNILSILTLFSTELDSSMSILFICLRVIELYVHQPIKSLCYAVTVMEINEVISFTVNKRFKSINDIQIEVSYDVLHFTIFMFGCCRNFACNFGV